MTEFLKCPGCGKVFKAPDKDYELFGRGFTDPGRGIVACPSCNLLARHKKFLKIDSSDLDGTDFHDGTSET